MTPRGIKLICEHADGEITTWHDAFNTTVEDVIKKVVYHKDWINGKFIEAYLEFENDGKYYKVFIDIKKQKLNQLLK